MKSIDKIAIEVAQECGSGMIPTLKEDSDYVEFARRLVEALGAQEPVATLMVNVQHPNMQSLHWSHQKHWDPSWKPHDLYVAPVPTVPPKTCGFTEHGKGYHWAYIKFNCCNRSMRLYETQWNYCPYCGGKLGESK